MCEIDEDTSFAAIEGFIASLDCDHLTQDTTAPEQVEAHLAAKDAEEDAAVLALRQAYENILCGDDGEQPHPPALSGKDSQVTETTNPKHANLDFPPGSAGARINAGLTRITEVETLRRLYDGLFWSAMSAASSGECTKFPPDLERIRWAQEAYLDFMNAADWIGPNAQPEYRTDFDTRSSTYPALTEDEAE